ncbi:MAG: hypothetical protein JM58_09440 [Peptococcaceae bacterium BICA1-8]|nr:MAG: hypothetical protein JM58_09440 [Peptococcaceae bacterium BICA1-8]
MARNWDAIYSEAGIKPETSTSAPTQQKGRNWDAIYSQTQQPTASTESGLLDRLKKRLPIIKTSEPYQRLSERNLEAEGKALTGGGELGKGFRAGIESTPIIKTLDKIVPDWYREYKGFEKPIDFTPTTTGEKIAYGAGNLVGDLPTWMAGYGVAGKIGQKLAPKLPKVAGAISKLSPTKKLMATEGLRGATTGGLVSPVHSLVEGDSPKEALRRAGAYILGGAVLDPLLMGAGAGLSNIAKKVMQRYKGQNVAAEVLEKALAKELSVDWDSMNPTQRDAIRKVLTNMQGEATASGRLLNVGQEFTMSDPLKFKKQVPKGFEKPELNNKTNLLSTNIDNSTKSGILSPKGVNGMQKALKRGEDGRIQIQHVQSDGERYIDITPDGQVVIHAYAKTPGDMRSLQGHLNRDIENYFSPLPENVYVRVSDNPDDFIHLKNGTHRGSKNHWKGYEEVGLSVAKKADSDAKYIYYVQGDKIAKGSDGEPILDVNTVKLVSKKPMTPKQYHADFDKKLQKKLQELGISKEDYRGLYWDSTITKGTPLQNGVEKKITSNIETPKGVFSLEKQGKLALPPAQDFQLSDPLRFKKTVEVPKQKLQPDLTPVNLPLNEVAATLEKEIPMTLKNPKPYQMTKQQFDEYAKVQKKAGQKVDPHFQQVSKAFFKGEEIPKQVLKEYDIDPILRDAVNWKDKKIGIQYSRETMQRNIEDIVPDKKVAQQINDKYFNPVQKSETERVKFLNTQRDDIKNLNLTRKEMGLVQKYGEGIVFDKQGKEITGKRYTLEDLKREAPDRWQEIAKAEKVFRQKYDSFLTQLNEALTRNGYKPIPKRENYFPHFDEIDGLLSKFGINMNEYSLPTDINGLTMDLKPGKSFFQNALQRKGVLTKYDALEGFDRYIEGSSRLMYHIDNIQNLRKLERNIRSGFKDTTHLSNFVAQLREYTNLLAGKKNTVDRVAESLVNRKIFSVMDWAKRKVGYGMVAGNVSTALTNFIPMTQLLATSRKDHVVRGLVETMVNVLKNDGFTQQSDFLVRRVGSNPLAMTVGDKVANTMFSPLRAVDYLTSQTIVRSKYYDFIGKGLKPEQAMKQADEWAAKILADRSLGSTPTLFNSKTLGFISQFQLEVNNQLSFAFKDIPQNYSKLGTASALTQLAVYGYVFNELYEKAIGRRPAFDILGIIQKAYEDYTDPSIDNSDATINLADSVLDQLPFIGAFTGGGRIPVSVALPDARSAIQGTTSWGKELSKPALYLGMPAAYLPAGQLKKTVEGVNAYNKGGSYKNDQLRYPVEKNTSNAVKGALFGQYSFPEAREYFDKNRRVLSKEQTADVNRLKGEARTKEYQGIMLDRRIATIDKKIDALEEKDMTEEKRKLLRSKLIRDIKKLEEEYRNRSK